MSNRKRIMPQSNISSRPPLDQGPSTARQRPFEPRKSNISSNPFSNRVLSDKNTKSPIKKAVKFLGLKPITLQKPKKGSLLSPKPTRVAKSKRSQLPMSLLATALKREGSSNKAKNSVTAKKGLRTTHEPQWKQQSMLDKTQKQSKSEHPLSLAFRGEYNKKVPNNPPVVSAAHPGQLVAHRDVGATLAYETHLKTEGPQALTIAVDEISARLRTADLSSSNLLSSYADSTISLSKPFKDEKLLLTLNSGTDVEKKLYTTIGERVEAFATSMKEKEKKLKDLWGEWESKVLEIETLRAGLTEGSDGDEGTRGYAFLAKELEGVYAAKRDQILKTFNEESEKLQRKARESEKNYEATVEQQRKALMQYMQLEAEVRDMSDGFDDEDGDGEEDEPEIDVDA